MTAVTNVLSNMSVQQMKMLSTPQELGASVQAFGRLNNFPRVIGAIDGGYVFKFYLYALMQDIVIKACEWFMHRCSAFLRSFRISVFSSKMMSDFFFVGHCFKFIK